MISKKIKFHRPRGEIFESSADREPGSTDLHGLQHPRIPQLVQDDLWVKNIWILKVKGGGLFSIYRLHACEFKSW